MNIKLTQRGPLFILTMIVVWNFGLTQTHPVFPDDYIGIWEGDLFIYSGVEQTGSIRMKMEILPTSESDRFSYVLEYQRPDFVDTRNYLLIVLNKEEGIFIIDEQNSILLDMRRFGNKLMSLFSVEQSWIHFILQMEPEELLLEVWSGSVKPKESTGGDNAPLVYNYPMSSYQKARLKAISR